MRHKLVNSQQFRKHIYARNLKQSLLLFWVIDYSLFFRLKLIIKFSIQLKNSQFEKQTLQAEPKIVRIKNEQNTSEIKCVIHYVLMAREQWN